jgi:hypothetical protein
MGLDIRCENGLCVVNVPDGHISHALLEIEEDQTLVQIKDELLYQMRYWNADSGIMLFDPAVGARRFGPKPESWLAEGVSIEVSEHYDLEDERNSMFQQYKEMVEDSAAGLSTSDTHQLAS